ncbi:MAG: [LysW]-aminoadipate kinase [Bdellovibrionales bacterium]|nr:[LysW]-aminoadipate kinase [Bdellovibrionales bacterium]
MIIVKIGGSKGIDDGPLLDDISALIKSGKEVLLVHGGSEETNQVAEALGHPPKFVTSVSGFESRFTDRRTLEIFTMVYCGRRNKSIVEGLQQRGINAVGLSGADGRVFEGPIKTSVKVIEDGKKKVLRGDNTGKVTKVNTKLLDVLRESGFTPVLCPPAISEEESMMMNVDGDRAAAMLAAAYHAEALVILSNVPGLLKDINAGIDNPDNLVEEIDLASDSDPYEFAKGRMKKKIMGAIEAVDSGVERVILASANVQQPISSALGGSGTHIHRSAASAAVSNAG